MMLGEDYGKAIFELLQRIDKKLAYLTPLSVEELTPSEQREALALKLQTMSLQEVANFVENDPTQIALRKRKEEAQRQHTAELARLAGADVDEKGEFTAAAMRSGYDKYVKVRQ